MSRLRLQSAALSEEDPDPLQDATWLYSYADMVTQLLLFVILTVTVVGLKEFKQPNFAAAPSVPAQLEDAAERLSDYVREHQLADLMSVDRSADRVTIRLKSLLLFDLGQDDLTPRALVVLRDVAALLAAIDRPIRVEGHTDNQPIHTARFPSNWELSSARAISVVQQLEHEGISRARLAAAGYGEHRPILANDSEERRALNRRVEIVILE